MASDQSHLELCYKLAEVRRGIFRCWTMFARAQVWMADIISPWVRKSGAYLIKSALPDCAKGRSRCAAVMAFAVIYSIHYHEMLSPSLKTEENRAQSGHSCQQQRCRVKRLCSDPPYPFRINDVPRYKALNIRFIHPDSSEQMTPDAETVIRVPHLEPDGDDSCASSCPSVCPLCSPQTLRRLKTFLISGRKLKLGLCSCPPSELRETISSSSFTHDIISCACAPAPAPDRAKAVCPSCSLLASENRHSCSDTEHKNSSNKGPAGISKKSLNGLLSPTVEQHLSQSQTSLCQMLQDKEKKWPSERAATMGTMDHSALIPLRSKNFRERSDAHFVDVIKEDSLMKDYFFKPPINALSHTFIDKSLESAYRTSYQDEVKIQAPVQTFASPTFSSFLDMLLCCCVLLALSVACFLRPLISQQPLPSPALIVAPVAAGLVCLGLLLAVRRAFYLDRVLNCTRTLLWLISGWLPRHMIGAVLVSLPALAVFSHITCSMHESIQFTMFICCAFIIAIIQYSNFCQLSFWMRSSLATLAGISFLSVLWSPPCRTSGFNTTIDDEQSPEEEPARPQDLLGPEASVAFSLLLLLVWFLNREFEVSYRLHYHGNVEADQHRIKIQNMRDQADWLLRNIIPIHVAEQLKVTQSYSKNHDNVGVIFASIVNFSEFYEESYEGGKECYRVLNELIGDFDELLRKSDFSNIEKIKTIGATYMAASGLNTQQCNDQNHPHGHLRALFEFSLEMMRVVDDFNKNMLGFKFKLRIGFNHGPLTAGVIGTTKLLYDIWGDTVNIASRMDTTGVECRVQVSEESYCVLSGMDYEFDYRGTVNVKGKGQMKTYLFPKSADSGPVPQYQLSVSPEIRAQVDGSIGRSPTDEIANMVPTTNHRVGASFSVSSGLMGQGYTGRDFPEKVSGSNGTSKTQRSASAVGLTYKPDSVQSANLVVCDKPPVNFDEGRAREIAIMGEMTKL
ncbi:hypothetical protein DNTS_020574 [Danionella cerebrum]|uniref:adenylate cyclase n=1 Tax=Danionella cerebrum TaxID=2873325 RepID=A0A553R514_9TELE|nr:hypothetical protein DNTS_020574 [Danionella translucida]